MTATTRRIRTTTASAPFYAHVVDNYGHERVYSTNRSGNGLWVGDQQIKGTAQFTARSRRQFRDALRRYLVARGDI